MKCCCLVKNNYKKTKLFIIFLVVITFTLHKTFLDEYDIKYIKAKEFKTSKGTQNREKCFMRFVVNQVKRLN